MENPPQFPEFKPIQLQDRNIIQEQLWRYQPDTSEWTFTNLFIWRSHYGFQWSMYRDWLLVISATRDNPCYALQPVGASPRSEIVRMLLRWLKDERGEEDPRIERADKRLVSELEGETDLSIEPIRDQFDYVYRTDDLIKLAGRKYHSKRNQVSQFLRSHSFSYAPLADQHVKECLNLTETWCEWHRCEEDMNLLDEWEAVRSALNNFSALSLKGGVILIEDKVEAFALGELLSDQTALVHIEKANPEIKGLYAIINQQFCEKAWPDISFVNREQDLGEAGLRKAKESYYPHHLEEKFTIRLSSGAKAEIT
ncbi:MAG: phosphatidylglycerol lysyltransferase domain-containing protein [Candidatus Zixiibacteriota bacterium]